MGSRFMAASADRSQWCDADSTTCHTRHRSGSPAAAPAAPRRLSGPGWSCASTGVRSQTSGR